MRNALAARVVEEGLFARVREAPDAIMPPRLLDERSEPAVLAGTDSQDAVVVVMLEVELNLPAHCFPPAMGQLRSSIATVISQAIVALPRTKWSGSPSTLQKTINCTISNAFCQACVGRYNARICQLNKKHTVLHDVFSLYLAGGPPSTFPQAALHSPYSGHR